MALLLVSRSALTDCGTLLDLLVLGVACTAVAHTLFIAACAG